MILDQISMNFHVKYKNSDDYSSRHTDVTGFVMALVQDSKGIEDSINDIKENIKTKEQDIKI